jgi:palmitoyl-protein thioesterase
MQSVFFSTYLLCRGANRCPSSVYFPKNHSLPFIIFEQKIEEQIKMSRLAFLLFTATILSHSIQTINYRPVVLMHGIVASASDMDELAGWLRTSFPGIYVVSIEIGNGVEDSFLWPLDKQVEHFYGQIRNDTHLQQGFNMLGFSQGSLIIRGAVERYSLPVYNLITLSGLHQGVFGIPYLLKLPAQFRELITKYAYEKTIQDRISAANYWRDPNKLNKYISDCHFLPDINNEREIRNETYRLNMLKLNAFVMTYSDIDEVVTPRESGWFMGYANESLKIETWNNSRQFTEDLIGMRTLLEQGKLHTFISHTRHQDTPHQPNKDFFLKNILPFFNNTFSK